MASEGSPLRGCLLIAQSAGLSRFGTRGSKGVPANSCRPTSGFPTSAPFCVEVPRSAIELTALNQLWRAVDLHLPQGGVVYRFMTLAFHARDRAFEPRGPY